MSPPPSAVSAALRPMKRCTRQPAGPARQVEPVVERLRAGARACVGATRGPSTAASRSTSRRTNERALVLAAPPVRDDEPVERAAVAQHRDRRRAPRRGATIASTPASSGVTSYVDPRRLADQHERDGPQRAAERQRGDARAATWSSRASRPARSGSSARSRRGRCRRRRRTCRPRPRAACGPRGSGPCAPRACWPSSLSARTVSPPARCWITSVVISTPSSREGRRVAQRLQRVLDRLADAQLLRPRRASPPRRARAARARRAAPRPAARGRPRRRWPARARDRAAARRTRPSAGRAAARRRSARRRPRSRRANTSRSSAGTSRRSATDSTSDRRGHAEHEVDRPRSSCPRSRARPRAAGPARVRRRRALERAAHAAERRARRRRPPPREASSARRAAPLTYVAMPASATNSTPSSSRSACASLSISPPRAPARGRCRPRPARTRPGRARPRARPSAGCRAAAGSGA